MILTIVYSRMASSGTLRHVILVRTDVSEEPSTSTITVTRIGELGTTLAVTSNRRMLRRNSKSHIAKMQRSPSTILRMIPNAPWYVTNQTLHDDLKVPFIKDVIDEKSINHHDKLRNYSNPILQSLLERQQRRRLKKLASRLNWWLKRIHSLEGTSSR
jgi:hypothetical protein